MLRKSEHGLVNYFFLTKMGVGSIFGYTGSAWQHVGFFYLQQLGANGTPLQYSCLENPMDGGAWWAAVHGVARVGHD